MTTAISLSLAALAMPAPTSAEAPGKLDLGAYHGKVVYLDFWASWCAPCKLSFQFMHHLRAYYPERDLAIVTVNLDHDPKAAAAFLGANGGGLPVVYDPRGSLANHFKVATMPTSMVIGRDGRVRFVHRGYFPYQDNEYLDHVRKLVGEHS